MNNKKQIVIIQSSPFDSTAKIPFALKNKEYETILITLTKSDENNKFIKGAYDQIITFDFKFFKLDMKNIPKIFLYAIKKTAKIINALYQINKLKPNIVIGMATPNWLCYLSRKFFKKSPFIYYPFDIRSFTHESLEKAKKDVFLFEIKAEANCFNESEGIIHKGAEDELTFLNKRVLGEVKIKCPTIYFLPYCIQKFIAPINKNKLSKKNKHINMVIIGAIDDKWITLINKITKQKIYFHSYIRWGNLSKEETKKRMGRLIKLSKKNKFIQIHNAVEQEKLAKEISKYDYGLYLYDMKPNIINRVNTGNKIFNYLEAGIPILTSTSYKATASIINKYSIGKIIKEKNLENLNNILKKQNYKQLEKNIIKARKELSMETQIPRLEKFFEEVIKYKNSK